VPSNRALRRDRKELARQQQGLTQLQAQIQTYQGPVPPPEILAQLDALVPGTAALILGDAHDQTQHRIALEKKVVHHDIWRSWAGLGAGLVVAGGGLGLAAYMKSTGDSDGARIVGGIDLVGLVSVFVVGAGVRFWERRQKFRSMTGL
jgi:hypothetical protein